MTTEHGDVTDVDMAEGGTVSVESCPLASCRFMRRRYDAFWHARWACFLDLMRQPYRYQPGHMGITTYLGVAPTFQLLYGQLNGVYVQVVPRWPAEGAAVAGALIARRTRERFLILPSPPYAPAPHLVPPSPPVWVCEPDGSLRMRFWAGKQDRLHLTGEVSHDMYEMDMLNALGIASAIRL